MMAESIKSWQDDGRVNKSEIASVSMVTGRIQGYITTHGRFAIVLYSIACHSNSMLFYFGATPHGTWDVTSFLSLMFSRSIVSDSLRPHGPQHARPPCPSPTPRACSNSCPSSRWCHPAISSSVVPFSSCLQWLPNPHSSTAQGWRPNHWSTSDSLAHFTHSFRIFSS